MRASVNGTVMPWYQGLAEREQRLIVLAACLLFFLFLLFGVIAPLHDKVVATRLEVARLANQAVETSRLADSIQHNRGIAGQQGDSLSVVEKVAVQTNVRSYMTGIHPQTGEDGGKQLGLQLTKVPYANVVRFVNALNRHHIGLQSLHIMASDNPGYVYVDILTSGN